jgi:hypothetical protein
MRVRGMDTDSALEQVVQTLQKVPGVARVSRGDAGRLNVDYDASELTVMDLIRALRRIGFLAGIE